MVSDLRCRHCDARARCPFSELSPDAKSELGSLSRSMLYGSGFFLFRQGEEATGVYIVRSGWLKLAFSSQQGNGASVGLMGPGSVLGLAQTLSGVQHSAGAHVVRSAELTYVERDRFFGFLEGHPRLTRRLLGWLGRDSARLMAELCETAGKLPAQQRLLRVLRELAADCGQPTAEGVRIGLPLTVQDLAERIGCSRQWTSRMLGELEQLGDVRRHRKWYVLPRSGAAASAST